MNAKAISRQDKAPSRADTAASWLWDPQRRRIVWADRAGLAFWGEATTGEIAERDFPLRAAAVGAFARLMEAARLSPAGIIERRLLLAPAGRPVRADCRGEITKLPDGRDGLRITARAAPAGQDAEADRLREILDEVPYPASLFAEDGGLLFQNLAAQTSFAQAGGASLVSRFGGRDAARNAIRATLVNGTHDAVLPVRTRHGSRRHRVMLRRMQDPVTGALAVLILFQDIGDRGEAARLMEAAPGGFGAFEADGRASYLNPEARHLLGLSAEEMPALTEIAPGQRHRIRTAMTQAQARLDLVAGVGRPVSLALRKLEDGGWAAAFSALDPARIEKAHAAAEATSRAEAASLLRIGSMLLRSDGKIERMDEIAAALLGEGSRARVGSTLQSALDAKAGARFEAFLTRGQAGTETLRLSSTRRVRLAMVPRADGRLAVALADHPAPPRGSELDRSEAIARVSHEIRTPMNAILGFSEIMLSEPDKIADPRFREYLADIQQAGQRVVAMADDLLDLRRAEVGAHDIRKAPVDLSNLVRTMANELSVRAERAGVALTLAIEPGLPSVLGDAHTLRQAFSNLLTNAVKFTGEGQSVRVAGARLPDGSARIDIIDTGPGMTAAELEQAMEPFGRNGRSGDGAGLGLPLSRRLIEANGARFEIMAEKDVGVVATVTFGPELIAE